MLILDACMLCTASTLSLFLLPHVLYADGNLHAMGFSYAQFMPKQHPVPREIDMLLVNVVAMYGACGVALNLMLIALALGCSDVRAKRL